MRSIAETAAHAGITANVMHATMSWLDTLDANSHTYAMPQGAAYRKGPVMAKAASKVVAADFDPAERVIIVHVAHTPYASYSRSVDPAAWKACKAVAKAHGIGGVLKCTAKYGNGTSGDDILSEYHWSMA